MNMHKATIAIFSLFLFVFLVQAAFGQNEPPRFQAAASYEVTLHLLVGSSDSGSSSSLPAELRAVTNQIKTNFGLTAFRLDNTFIGRVGNGGSFEYKSVASTMGTGADSDTPTFQEWTLGTLKSSTDDKGRLVFQAEPFRFGAKIPVKTSTMVGDNGKSVSTVNYESVGLTVNRVSLTENTPTLIGTLSLPKTAGTLFLVLTVRSAQ